MTEPGQPCPVCGLPDPQHDWDVHERQQVVYAGPAPAWMRGAANMLTRSSSRGSATVRWLAVHSTEGIMDARDLRDWVSWPGSSHASADATGRLLEPADGFVPYERSAWTLRDGNPVSENIELCALAGWTRAQWLARPDLLDACARWLAARSKARGIPLRKLTVAQVRAGWAGVIDHDDYTDATGDGSHWDVGEQFPWDVVMPAAQRYAQPPQPPKESDDMAAVSQQDWDDSQERLKRLEDAQTQTLEAVERLVDVLVERKHPRYGAPGLTPMTLPGQVQWGYANSLQVRLALEAERDAQPLGLAPQDEQDAPQ